MNEDVAKEIAIRLVTINAIKFGSFIMKSGEKSPIYFDLRVIISYPSLMEKVASLLWDKVKLIPCETLCGVPYTALPFATCISLRNNIPMVMRRKETKSYGTKRSIEGVFQAGQNCIVVEDVVTSGSSIMETVRDLRDAGLNVRDAVVLIDREQGGKCLLSKEGISLHSVFTIRNLLSVLRSEGKLTADEMHFLEEYLQGSQFTQMPSSLPSTHHSLTFEERSALCKNGLTKRIFNLIVQKKSNLCLSADVTSSEKLLKLADDVGPYIVILKTHADIVQDFNKNLATRLTDLARKHNFLIFEDRKFCDIGNTVKMQYSAGVYCVSEWAHLVTAHAIPGDGVLTALKEANASREDRGCILVVEMSSAGNLTNDEYKNSSLKMAKDHDDFVVGIVCQTPLNGDPTLLRFVPGVKLGGGNDSLGQQYVSPREAVMCREADIVIVGRGITEAEEPTETAILYRQEAYHAYEARCRDQIRHT